MAAETTTVSLRLTEAQLESLRHSHTSWFPELEAAQSDPHKLRETPAAQVILAHTELCMEGIETIPHTTYTAFRDFIRNGDRRSYQTPYFRKRSNLTAAALCLFFGQSELKDVVQDYLWSICEESNWVVPAHERGSIIDLFAAETGFALAQMLVLLGDVLDAEVRHRVRMEVERRILEPYLRHYGMHWWYDGGNNWNGVCNASVAATFLLMEPETERMIQGLTLALQGLEVFLQRAFEEDGSSTEGVAYWHFGLTNFVALAEMLYARSDGAINLLEGERMRLIAAYPPQMQLSSSRFASFSDCDEFVRFHPGIIARLAERTHEPALTDLVSLPWDEGEDPDYVIRLKLPTLLRDMLWWDGQQHQTAHLNDVRLPGAGLTRLVGQTHNHAPVVLMVKAGHNAENHNQNDVGSFILHVDGESLLADPGRGLYSRDYFNEHRYENIFVNSYGHSVPRIDRHLQGVGRDFAGHLIELEEGDGQGQSKRVALEFACAYPCPDLVSLRRELVLANTEGVTDTLWLRDHFTFSEGIHEVEEALLTWHECEVDGSTALIRGQRHDLRLIVEQPQGLSFVLEVLEEQSRANEKSRILKRLSMKLTDITDGDVSLQMQIVARGH